MARGPCNDDQERGEISIAPEEDKEGPMPTASAIEFQIFCRCPDCGERRKENWRRPGLVGAAVDREGASAIGTGTAEWMVVP